MSTQPQPTQIGAGELMKSVGEIASKAAAAAVAELAKELRAGQDKQTEILDKLATTRTDKAQDEDEPDIYQKIRERKKAIFGKAHYGASIRCLALANLENKTADPEAAMHAIKRDMPVSIQGPYLKWCQFVKTTLAAGNPTVAGDIIIPAFDPEWIELLRNNAVVRGTPGVRVKGMPRGAITQRKQTGTATAAYQGELGPTSPSNLTVGKAEMSYKKLRAQSIVSNDEIRFGGPEVDQIIQDDQVAASALREDQAFLVGNPPTDVGSPQGIRYQTLAGNIAASAGTSLANFQTDATALVSAVQSKNLQVTPANACFYMSVTNFWRVYALTTTTGDWVFRTEFEKAQPTLLGFPVRLTTQLEVTNSFIGANSGLLFFVHAPSLVIWDSMMRSVEVFRGGAYYDGTTVQSGISNDETVIVCTSEHDFQQRYQEAAAIRTGYAS